MGLKHYILAVDPGGTCGWALYELSLGLVSYGYDPPWDAARQIVRHARDGVVDHFDLEATFTSVRRSSAGNSAGESAGFVWGALRWAAVVGPTCSVIRPTAAAWRSDVGIELWKADQSGGVTKTGRPRKVRRKRAELERDARSVASEISGEKMRTKDTHSAEAICMGFVRWRRVNGEDPTWVSRRAA